MIMFYYLASTLSFTVGTIIFVRTVVSILKYKQNLYNFAIVIYYIFFILPIFLDMVFGVPNYSNKTLIISSSDVMTNSVYSIVIFIPYLMLSFFKRPAINFTKNHNSSKILLAILFIVSLLPLFYFLIYAPNKELFLTYAWYQKGLVVSLESLEFRGKLLGLTKLSILALVSICFLSKNSVRTSLLVSPIALIIFYLDGKRTIVFMYFGLMLAVYWYKKVFTAHTFILLSVVTLMLLAGFNSFYQNEARDFKDNTFEENLTGFRIDYGRDAVTKFSIHKKLNKDLNQILEYPGQSMLFSVLIFVPREMWPEKPYPYAVYLTSSILGLPPTLLGWGITTSLVDESISNFGIFLGSIFSGIVFCFICKYGQKYDDDLFFLYTIVIIIFMITLQLSAFFIPFLIWCMWLLYNRNKDKKNRGKQYEKNSALR
ncbi:hypothetical protein ACWOFO_13840 [Carnobacterium maltaromaticum]